MRQIVYGCICLLQDPAFVKYDFATKEWSLDESALDEHFRIIANTGADGIRLLPWGPWEKHPHGMESQFQPYGVDDGVFDLQFFNQYYFPIVKRVIEIANKRGLRVWWVWLDNCQFFGAYKQWSPWARNLQGIADFYDPKALTYIRVWIQKCYDEFNGLKVGWCFGNETNRSGMRLIFQGAIVPMIEKLGLDPELMTYGATMETQKYYPPPDPIPDKWEYYLPATAGVLDELKKLAGIIFGDKFKLAIWKEVHSIGGKGYPKIPNRLHQAMAWWFRKADNGIRVWLSDDGVFDGDSECDVEFFNGVTQRRPSADRWAEIVKLTKAYANDLTFEHLPKTSNMKCIVATMKAIYRALYGRDPVEKYPPPPPPTVSVIVCAKSGILPSLYCPSLVARNFVKGEEPTTGCTIHKEPPPALEYEDISVCQESHLLPSPYCQVVVIEKFIKGLWPTLTCPLHIQPLPPPPTPVPPHTWMKDNWGYIALAAVVALVFLVALL